MKTLTPVTLLIALTATMPSLAHAAKKVLWDCNGSDVEGLTITSENGALRGNFSWDCFPGDGICNTDSAVSRQSAPGTLKYAGRDFTLEIRFPAHNGEYRARISATAQGDKDMGGGFRQSEVVSCSIGQ